MTTTQYPNGIAPPREEAVAEMIEMLHATILNLTSDIGFVRCMSHHRGVQWALLRCLALMGEDADKILLQQQVRVRVARDGN